MTYLRNSKPTDFTEKSKYIANYAVEYSKDLNELNELLRLHEDPVVKKLIKESLLNDLLVKYTPVIGNNKGNLEKMLKDDLASYEKGVFDVDIEKLLINFADFLKQDHKLSWLWVGHIPLGCLMWIYANAKTGKSDFINSLMYAVIHSGEFLGFPVKKGKVLYVQAEESNLSIQIKAKSHGFLHPEVLDEIEKNDSVKLLRRLNLVQDFEKLVKIVERYEPTLVVIDTVITVMDNSGLNVKDNEFVSIFRRIQSEICIPFDVTVLALHHVTKEGKMSGSNYLSSVGDGAVKLERSSGTLTNLLFDTRNSGKFNLTVSRNINEDNNLVEYVLVSEEGLNKEESDIRLQIIRTLLNKQRITAQELYDTFKNKESVKNVINRLLNCCMIDYEVNTTDNVITYHISEDSKDLWNNKYINELKKDVEQANILASLSTKAEIQDYTKEWEATYKNHIWNLLVEGTEKEHIKQIFNE